MAKEEEQVNECSRILAVSATYARDVLSMLKSIDVMMPPIINTVLETCAFVTPLGIQTD